ncbi:hypothetical protein O7627_36920 [Solwaraspora sp. WMMD1047]|uniref:hypothetical protein n=1 Tax=Solwaraspora sp. WMMD1047 TaxID=3016102 RepID=UPI0024166DDB|nr:hypothetical protein [Solwaraspora sp. WMMD1047]MDG4834854.1 hypothetical protein [Solwaraspora sp. WMMD1047]
MPARVPAIEPNQRHPDEIANAATYHRDDPVWAWAPFDRQWRPGVVDAGSNLAVLVTFRWPGGGTGVDSLLPRHVMPRTERDEDLDRAVADPSLPVRLRNTQPPHTDSVAASRPAQEG